MDFKETNEESNIPLEKRVENTTKKIEEKKVNGFEKLEMSDLISDLEEKTIKEPKIKYRIIINDYPKFDNGTNGDKNSILRKYKNKSSGGYGWYKLVFDGVKSQMLSANPTHLYVAKNAISKIKPVSKNDKVNKGLSVTLIENYISMYSKLPNVFRTVVKNPIKPSSGSFIFEGIKISVNPELVFSTIDKDGKKLLGAIKFNMNKTGPSLSEKGRKIIATLLFKFLQEIYKDTDYTVDPNLCMSLDVFKGNYSLTPTGADVPYRSMIRIAKEYKIHWDSK